MDEMDIHKTLMGRIMKVQHLKDRKKLLSEVIESLKTPTVTTVLTWSAKLKEEGIERNMHVGKGDQMQGKSTLAYTLSIEWLLGALIDIQERGAYWTINMWIGQAECTLKEIICIGK